MRSIFLTFPAIFILLFSLSTLAAEPNDFTGSWIEQADDPLKITLTALSENQLEARISHGPSDQVRTLTLGIQDNLLLSDSGHALFELHNGKLRQLNAKQLTLFVKLK